LVVNGHNIIGEANDGETGYQSYCALKPDIVLLDITMSNVDGLKALKRIMAYDANARVVMCSAMGQKMMVLEAIEYGAKDFIVKPFQSERVVEAVAKALNE
jgi:two-component system chemotaxis response regulator CheY